MTNRTHNFLDKFNHFDNNTVEVKFADAFAEFIECLSLADLSKNTLDDLFGIFEKDMKIFFRNQKEGDLNVKKK